MLPPPLIEITQAECLCISQISIHTLMLFSKPKKRPEVLNFFDFIPFQFFFFWMKVCLPIGCVPQQQLKLRTPIATTTSTSIHTQWKRFTFYIQCIYYSQPNRLLQYYSDRIPSNPRLKCNKPISELLVSAGTENGVRKTMELTTPKLGY